MSIIGITINEVLRDFVGQFQTTYNKYIAREESEELEYDFTTHNLLDIKGVVFKKPEQLNNFLYLEAPLEIFGHADMLHENLNAKVNEFLMDIEDEEEHEIVLISVEHDKSIPATNFFLSKTGFRFRNIKFVTNKEEIWDKVDVLITSNPELLNLKPEGKISIKIDFPYNKEVDSDYNYKTLIDFIDDREILNKTKK